MFIEEHVEGISVEMPVSAARYERPGLKEDSFSAILAPFSSSPSRSFATRLNVSFRFQARGLMNNQLDLSQDSISWGCRECNGFSGPSAD